MKVNASIHDFAPLLKRPEILFKGLKESGIDGIELGIGFKSRWLPNHYASLSKKYELPIVSLHQPLWAGMGLYFDEGFFDIAKKLGVKHVVCHPLPKISFEDKRMRKYLKRLSEVQKSTDIEILLENLPEKYSHKLLNFFFPPQKEAGNIMSIYEAVSEFNLNLTLDIDHLQSLSPHTEKWFNTVFPKIRNIHLSSFDGKKRHMPLYLGDFDAVTFIRHLEKMRYSGLLTFEINHPGAITLLNYDFNAIKRSVEIMRRITAE